MAPRINCLCMDNSRYSYDALTWYFDNFHRSDDVIALIHIHQMPQLPSMGLMAGALPVTDDYRTSIKKSIDESNGLIEKFKKRCEERNATHKILKSDSHHSPGQVICDLAKENNASAIILGQRGLSKFSRALLGSTSDYVLHHSDITVIVVPPKNASD